MAALTFDRHFADAGKPIAAICHAPWLLVEADVVRGRRVTSYPSLKTDLRNAGAEWVDREVVVDREDLDEDGALRREAVLRRQGRERPQRRRTLLDPRDREVYIAAVRTS